MKIVTIGTGKVGNKVARQLSREGHDVTVVDRNAEALQAVADTEDVMCVLGNAANYQTQEEAGVPAADLLIACTNNDETNLLSCLMAKKHGAKKTVARLQTPEYSEQIPYIQDELGIGFYVNPVYETALLISKLLKFPAAINIETFAGGKVEMIALVVDQGDLLIGKTLRQLDEELPVKLLICAIIRDDAVFIPNGQDTVKEGDRLYIASTPENLHHFSRVIGLKMRKIRSVMIIGGGKTGTCLAKMLVKQGMRVKIIEIDSSRSKDIAAQLEDVDVIGGDGTDEELLGEEGLAEMDAFIAATDKDEMNVMLSLYAHSCDVSKVIATMQQSSFQNMLVLSGVDTLVSPKAITASRILSYVRSISVSQESNAVRSLSRFASGRLEALEFVVEHGDAWIGKPIRDLKIRKGFLIGCIVHDHKVIIPGGSDKIEQGDTVVLVTTIPKVRTLEEMLEST